MATVKDLVQVESPIHALLVIYKFKYGLYEALISTVKTSLTHFA